MSTLALGDHAVVRHTFSHEPDEVHAAYCPPGAPRPIVDPGSNHPGSRLHTEDGLTWSYDIDTSRCRPGVLSWRLWSESGVVDQSVGQIKLSRDGGQQVLGGGGYAILGELEAAKKSERTAWMVAGVSSLVAVGALLWGASRGKTVVLVAGR